MAMYPFAGFLRSVGKGVVGAVAVAEAAAAVAVVVVVVVVVVAEDLASCLALLLRNQKFGR